jgi:CubicO group peptidase (beta-lactamase class C family)
MKRIYLFVLMAVLFAIPSQGQEGDTWKAKIDAAFEAYNAPGAEAMIAILSKDKGVYAAFFSGDEKRDLSDEQLLREPFALHLMSKPFTSMAIMQLVDKGKVALNDPITKYLPLSDKFEDVQIRNLMNHTSGITSLEILPDNYQALFSTLNASQKEEVEANKSWGYANVDYPLLAAIIEKASGRSYAEYMHKRIFRKAKMEASGIAGDENTPASIEGIDLSGERGVYSTFSDMAKWNGALYTNRLVDCEQMADIFSIDTLANGKQVPYYGYGWVLMERQGLKYYWVGSGEEGHNHMFVHYPQKRITIVIITKGEARENLLKKAMEIHPLIPKEELVLGSGD